MCRQVTGACLDRNMNKEQNPVLTSSLGLGRDNEERNPQAVGAAGFILRGRCMNDKGAFGFSAVALRGSSGTRHATFGTEPVYR